MEFMSQFDAKIVYITGEEDTVVDVLSSFPSPNILAEAERSPCHPYTFCNDYDNISMIVSISLPCLWGPWESATHLSGHVSSVLPICTTLKIMADKAFLNAIRSGYAEDA